MVLHIKDFLKDESNATPAFVEAIGAMNDGDTLCLDGGEFNLRPEGAFIKTWSHGGEISMKNVTSASGEPTDVVFTEETFECKAI